jgi:hypothetical protein
LRSSRSRIPTERSAGLTPYSSEKVDRKKYRSAIAQDASSSPSFAGFYSAPYYQTIFGPGESGAWALVSGDFNHDGKTDLASVTFLGGVAVLLNNGTGEFGSPIVSQIGATLVSIQGGLPNYPAVYAVDLNGDGYTDLVIPTPGFELAVLINHKDGTFPTTTYVPLQNLNSSSTTPADGSVAQGKTTASGGIDLVSVQSFTTTSGAVTQTTIQVETLLNDGTGNFPTQKTMSYTAPVVSYLQTSPIATLADVNQDGKLDLLVARNGWYAGPLYVDVLLGNGDGTFLPPGAAGTITIAGNNEASFGNSLTTANLTAGSSIPDIVLATYFGIYICKGNGDGTFQTATQPLPGFVVSSLQIADLNGDGRPDLVVDSPGGVVTLLGNGDGTFGAIAGTAISGDPGSELVQQMVVADFNGDGKADFAAVNAQDGNVEVAAGNGLGGFHATPTLYSTSVPVLNPQQLYLELAGDILGNGTRQLIGQGDAGVLSGLPNGKDGFNYVNALPSVASGTSFGVDSVTGDFNGDGKQDIILWDPLTGNTAVALSKGDGTFETPVNVPSSGTHDCSIDDVAVGDVNGDGKLDLVGATTYVYGICPSGYLVALGNGDGTFKTATFTPSGQSLFTVALAAYHGPGKPLDLVTLDEGLGVAGSTSVVYPSVNILTGNGDGTFGTPVILFNSSILNAYQLLTDDYNQDGKPDLTFFDGWTDATSGAILFAGNGDGTFAAPKVISSIEGAYQGTYGDVNNDGIPDLIFTGYSGLSVALGTGGGSFATPISYFAPPSYGPILAGFFLGDNAQSLILTGIGGSAFFMNQGGTMFSVVSNMTTLPVGGSLQITVPLKATVQDQPVPTGTITLYDGSTVLSSGPVSGFSFSTTQLAVGSHSIKATYSGDSQFYPNTSPAVAITVTAVASDFTLNADPAIVTVSPGQSASFKMAVSANATLTGNVTFQCSGLPAEAACAFNPASLSVAAGQSGSVTLAITTKAPTTAQASPGSSPFFAGYAIAVLILFAIPRRRRNLFRVLVLFCAVMSPLVGCGGSSHKQTDPGTPAGISTVTVTATVTSGKTTVTHTSTIKLVVQ